MSPTLLVGTTKGLVVFKQQNKQWTIDKIHFLGMSVSVVYVDTLNQTWWASISHHHWGQKLHYSKDEGRTWQRVASPKYPSKSILSSGKQANLKKIWCIQQGGVQYPNRIWIGTEPGGLFLSEDYGKTFELVTNLWNHPSRMDKQQWFGTGRSAPYIHSIVVDPRDNKHLYIAVSCAGIFETLDGGQSWRPRNKGLIAAYLPNPSAEVGHDPHLLLACASNPEVLWQQNHCGIFRTTDGGKFWENISDTQGIANYGFALAIDNENTQKAWVIPAQSDENRIAPNLALSVCHTNDGGQTWQDLRNGLPQENCFDIVFRHALAKTQQLLAFGTTTGNLYLSDNEGINWSCIANTLARIDCVAFDIRKTVTNKSNK